MSDKPVCAVVGIGPKNGAAFARRFAADGYVVALMSRKMEFSSKLAAELGDAKAFACDVSDPDSIAKAFGEVREQLGAVDTVIYNAGSGGNWGDIENVTVDDFEGAWRVNARGLFLTTKQLLPAMLDKAAGNIIVVGATASLRGKPFTTSFAPAKAAQRSLAQALARHLAPKGIHVSLLIIDGMIGDALREPAAEPAQLDPSDIAHAAAFLAGQPSSAWTFELDLRPQMENW